MGAAGGSQVAGIGVWLSRKAGIELSVFSCEFAVLSFKCKNELICHASLTQVDGVAYAVGPESFPGGEELCRGNELSAE
jgi:hypothetical protein